MFADKLRQVFHCRRWVAFKKLESLKIKPVYSVNRNITNNSQPIKKLLHLNKPNCANSIARCYATVLHRENLHAHQVMSNLTAYSNSLSPTLSLTEDFGIDSIENLLDQQWISMSNGEILKNFKLLSHHAYQNSEAVHHLKYQGIFDILAEKCLEFSNEELFDFLALLQMWDSSCLIKTNLWKALDKACISKLPIATIDQIFLISDHMYKLGVVRFSSFIYHAMRKLNPKEMTSANLVQYAFLMKVRGLVPGVNVPKFEFYVEKNIDHFTVEELGIICMSFFKYQTAIKSDVLFLKILQQIQIDLNNVSDISLSAVMKTLRYSADLNVHQQIAILLKVMENQIEYRSLMNAVQTAIAQGTLLIDNPSLLKKIIEKFERETGSARLKDIERLTLVLYVFNYDPKTVNFFNIAEQELHNSCRRDEIFKHRKSYVYTIMYMLKLNYFPEELVKKIMAPDFINRFCNNDISALNREYLDISYCLKIDHPHYKGPQLRTDQLKYLIKKFGVFHKDPMKKYQKVNHDDKLIIDLLHHIKLTLGSESSIHVDYPLPYSNRQYIFMCYEAASQTFLPPAKPLKDIPLGEIKYAPKDGKQWIAIVPASHNILTRNSNRPTGQLAMQMRHLERMGYKTILITYNEWNQLNSQKKKLDYLRYVIDNL